VNYADELLGRFHAEVNAAEHAVSTTVAECHQLRALRVAIELDRFLCEGNPPPLAWARPFAGAAVVIQLATGVC
jgi:hypothetical protein